MWFIGIAGDFDRFENSPVNTLNACNELELFIEYSWLEKLKHFVKCEMAFKMSGWAVSSWGGAEIANKYWIYVEPL